mgnify:CR=1 FL=1
MLKSVKEKITMRRIVYSIFTNKIDEHPSADNFKKNQFVKYKNKIIEAQSKYAKICNASYKLFETTNTNYNEFIQQIITY